MSAIAPTRFLALLCGVACLAAGSLPATMIEQPDFDDLTQRAGMVFRGRVLESAAKWVNSPDGRAIVTTVRFKVLETYKGTPGDGVSLDFLGGRVGEDAMEVEGMPTFAVGDDVILFTNPEPNALCPVLGWHFGLFKVSASATGQTQVSGATEVPAAASAGPVAKSRPRVVAVHSGEPAKAAPLSLDEFKQRLRARLPAGQQP